MGYVPDERLSRMFEQQHVTFFQPPEEDSWFNLFVIHQNCESGRSLRSMRLDLLPAFLQLVIWGHEHECKVDPSWNDEGVGVRCCLCVVNTFTYLFDNHFFKIIIAIMVRVSSPCSQVHRALPR